MKSIINCMVSIVLVAATVPANAGVREVAFSTSGDPPTAHAFMFAGASVRVGFDRNGTVQPQAALRLTGATVGQGGLPHFGEGIALTAGATAKPRLTLAGQDSAIVGQRLSVSGAGKTALIVGGVVLLLGVAAIVAWKSSDPDILGDDCVAC